MCALDKKHHQKRDNGCACVYYQLHVSLNPNMGPVIAHTTMTITASTKVTGLPLQRAVNLANRVNHDLDFVGLML